MNERAEVYQKVVKLVSEQLHKQPEEIIENATLESLGADSLDRVELIMKIEEIFGIEVDDQAAETLITVQDAVNYITSLINK